jgi:RNA polymerase sigma factor (sigma-70 family)
VKPRVTRREAPTQLLQDLFLTAYPFARRSARARSAAAPAQADLGTDDLEQEALLALWSALPRFDPARAGLRTFTETVVGNKISSIQRRAAAPKRSMPFEYRDCPNPFSIFLQIELRVDVSEVLGYLDTADLIVAHLLSENGPAQIARILQVSRASVYRSIARIRTALLDRGFCRQISLGPRTLR